MLPGGHDTIASPRTQLSELFGALTLSTDLAFGQPMEHVMRACLIALRIADSLGLDERTRADAYSVTMLATVCTGESFEMVQAFGDDIAFRSGMYHLGPSQFAVMFYAGAGGIRQVGVVACEHSGEHHRQRWQES